MRSRRLASPSTRCTRLCPAQHHRMRALLTALPARAIELARVTTSMTDRAQKVFKKWPSSMLWEQRLCRPWARFHGTPDGKGLHCFAHIMHAHNARTALHCKQRRSHAGLQPLVHIQTCDRAQ